MTTNSPSDEGESTLYIISGPSEPNDDDIIEIAPSEPDWWKQRAFNRPISESKAQNGEGSYNSPSDKLPEELWQLVYAYLEPIDLLALSHVSWGFALELNVDAALLKQLAHYPTTFKEVRRITYLGLRQEVLCRSGNLSRKICTVCARLSLAPLATCHKLVPEAPFATNYDLLPETFTRVCDYCFPSRYEIRMCVAEAKLVFRIPNKAVQKDRWDNQKHRRRSKQYSVKDWHNVAIRWVESGKSLAKIRMERKPDLPSEFEVGSDGNPFASLLLHPTTGLVDNQEDG